MRLKYSPCKHDRDTLITVMDDNALNIDGEVYEFDPLDVAWPTIAQDTDGVILEAHRDSRELYVTVRRFYSGNCSAWDDVKYHTLSPGESA
jgi:hypothetical protein